MSEKVNSENQSDKTSPLYRGSKCSTCLDNHSSFTEILRAQSMKKGFPNIRENLFFITMKIFLRLRNSSKVYFVHFADEGIHLSVSDCTLFKLFVVFAFVTLCIR